MHTHAGPGLVETVVPLVVLLGPGAAYVLLASRRRRDPLGWSRWRTASFLGGLVLLAVALAPGLSPWAPGDLRGHMLGHLLIGMYAPLGLVLGAPVTLALRSLPHRHARRLGRAMHAAPVAVLAHPVTGLLLTVGGLVVLYATPLYALSVEVAAVNHLVHVHFLLAGCAFAHAIAGPDPAPHRPSVPYRLVVLGVAVLGHAVVSQLMYAGLVVRVPVPAAELRGAAELMYYGGDVAELLLALAVVSTWRPARPSSSGSRKPRSQAAPSRRKTLVGP